MILIPLYIILFHFISQVFAARIWKYNWFCMLTLNPVTSLNSLLSFIASFVELPSHFLCSLLCHLHGFLSGRHTLYFLLLMALSGVSRTTLGGIGEMDTFVSILILAGSQSSLSILLAVEFFMDSLYLVAEILFYS